MQLKPLEKQSKPLEEQSTPLEEQSKPLEEWLDGSILQALSPLSDKKKTLCIEHNSLYILLLMIISRNLSMEYILSYKMKGMCTNKLVYNHTSQEN